MIRYYQAFLIITLTFTACSSVKKDTPVNVDALTVQPTVSAEDLGQTVLLEGKVESRKNGLSLVNDGLEVWLLDEDVLPADYFAEDHTGPSIRLQGTLGEDQNLPIFIDGGSGIEMNDPLGVAAPKAEPESPDEGLAVQGIPMPPGTDLEAARHRWVLRDMIFVGYVD